MSLVIPFYQLILSITIVIVASTYDMERRNTSAGSILFGKGKGRFK